MIGGGNYPINLNSISLLTEKHADKDKKEPMVSDHVK